VSRGVHNIAFLLSPDHFRAFDLCFFTLKLGLSVTKGAQCLGNNCNTECDTKQSTSWVTIKSNLGRSRRANRN